MPQLFKSLKEKKSSLVLSMKNAIGSAVYAIHFHIPGKTARKPRVGGEMCPQAMDVHEGSSPDVMTEAGSESKSSGKKQLHGEDMEVPSDMRRDQAPKGTTNLHDHPTHIGTGKMTNGAKVNCELHESLAKLMPNAKYVEPSMKAPHGAGSVEQVQAEDAKERIMINGTEFGKGVKPVESGGSWIRASMEGSGEMVNGPVFN